MNKILIVSLLIGMFMIASVSSYICIREDDNAKVQEFKQKMNVMALENDIVSNNLTEEAFYLKLKYFNPCN